MEEKRERKLHLLIETAIIAIIIFGCNLALSYGILFLANEDFNKYSSLYSATRWLELLFPVIAALLCVNVIEKRRNSIVKTLITSSCISLLGAYTTTITTVFVGRYGDQALASFFSVELFLAPVLIAFFIAVFVNILCAPKAEAYIHDEKMHCGLFAHVFLLLFSFGIWQLIWNYRVTRYLNCVEDEKYRNPATKLLLCMFVPFYSIYWTYKSAQRIDKLAKSVDIVSDLATPCLILEIFVPVIPPILMQDKINKIIETA